MTNAVARLSAVALVGLLAVAIVALVVTSQGPLDRGRELQAEFVDASPLVEGMSVRVSGAVAGSVNEIELNDEGVVEVTMSLHEGLPEPRADASAAIRQQDVLGDSYLNLELGHAKAPLEGPIATERTVTSPRFDEFFDIFKPNAREGLQVFLIELGRALERRGAGLNEAILKLRPGFRAADELLTQLRGQNRVFHELLENSNAISSQIAPETEALDRAIVGLERTFSALAAHSGALDEALSELPASLELAHATTRRLRSAVRAAVPLLRTLGEGAPEFTRASRLLGPFSTHLAETSREVGPTVRLTAKMLKLARPALRKARGRTAELFSSIVLAFEPLAPLLDDLVGGIVRFGNVIVPPEPGADPARSHLRAVLATSCEVFGEPIAPGCLGRVLAGSSVRRGAATSRPARDRSPALSQSGDQGAASGASPPPADPGPSGSDRPEPGAPAGPAAGPLKDVLDLLLGP